MNKPVNSIEYARLLEQAGMERAHAEAVANLQIRVVSELVENQLVTKEDLKVELHGLELKMRDEIRGESAKLRQEISGESAKLREEMRGMATSLRQEMSGESAKLRDEIRKESTSLREEIRNETTSLREEMRNIALAQDRRIDAIMLQIRALQMGGAIAAFAISMIVLLSRLIR